jgi:hypothetical protein
VERLEDVRVVREVKLVAGRALEGGPTEGTDLAGQPVAAQERERTAGDRGACDLEVDGKPPRAAQVDASGGPDEGGELGQPAAGLPRVDRRQLAPDVLGEAQGSVTPSRARRRSL